MRLLAVAMRDVAVFKRDTFWVEVAPNRVEPIEIDAEGGVHRIPAPPLATDALEFELLKRRAGYLLVTPIEIGALTELSGLLGAFVLQSDGRCQVSAGATTAHDL